MRRASGWKNNRLSQKIQTFSILTPAAEGPVAGRRVVSTFVLIPTLSGGSMRKSFVAASIFALALLALAQQPTMPTKFGDERPTGNPADDDLRAMFESKIKAEWEAIKNKDKKAYGELLADDYQGVEVDGRGERNKIQAVNELVETNVFNYTLWGLKVIPAGPDATLVIYESTMQ